MAWYIWAGIGAGVLLFFFAAARSRGQYTCPSCGHVFLHSPLAGLLVPHNTDSRLITCPRCGYSDYMQPDKPSGK